MENLQEIWNQYLKHGGSPDLTGFGVFLIKNADQLSLKDRNPAGDLQADAAKPAFTSHSNRAGMLMGRLERFVYLQAKPRLKKAGLDNPDDFGLMAALYFRPGITKGQLLRQSLVEPATGTEMLKRLKKAGFILEKPNPEDGRSLLVTLSARGKKLLEACFRELGGLNDVMNCLSEQEQMLMVNMLERLDHFHSEKAGVQAISEWMKPG